MLDAKAGGKKTVMDRKASDGSCGKDEATRDAAKNELAWANLDAAEWPRGVDGEKGASTDAVATGLREDAGCACFGFSARLHG